MATPRRAGLGERLATMLVAAFVAVVVIAVAAVDATSDAIVRHVVGPDGHTRLYDGRQLVRFDGRGPEWWAARARRMHALADARARQLVAQAQALYRTRAQLAGRLESLPPRTAIRLVFGPYAEQALAVSSCETGGTYSTTATNGQYLGLFQMGDNERATYGYGSTPLEQSLGAYVYFVVSGRGWGPWECKP